MMIKICGTFCVGSLEPELAVRLGVFQGKPPRGRDVGTFTESAQTYRALNLNRPKNVPQKRFRRGNVALIGFYRARGRRYRTVGGKPVVGGGEG